MSHSYCEFLFAFTNFTIWITLLYLGDLDWKCSALDTKTIPFNYSLSLPMHPWAIIASTFRLRVLISTLVLHIPWDFFKLALTDGFTGSLCDSEISRTPLSILANSSSVIVRIVSVLLLIASSSSQVLGDCSKGPNYDWYHYLIHVPLIFQFSGK